MTPLSRPAATAIAAFLVLSTPSAFAQTAPSEVASPPPVADPVIVPPVAPTTVPAPTMTAPVATPTAPAPVIRVPLEIEPATAPATKAAAPKPSASTTARTNRAANETRAAATTAPAAATAAPVEALPAITDAEPLPSTVITPAVPMADNRAVAATDAVRVEDGFPWELAIGGAALLLVGGAGIAFARRRRSDNASAPSYVEAAPMTAPATREPIATQVPAYMLREEQSTSAPLERTTPAFAAAPSGSMGRHEAMALSGPTVDNPFVTLRKRLKRARFYDRQDRLAYAAKLSEQKDLTRKPASAWEIANRADPAPAQQEVIRPARSPGYAGGLRPGFAGKR